jgi:hypothetical protein
VHTLKRWWLNNWDTAVLVALMLSVALGVGGIVGATVDAVQRAATP